jgi:hypothetical protein
MRMMTVRPSKRSLLSSKLKLTGYRRNLMPQYCLAILRHPSQCRSLHESIHNTREEAQAAAERIKGVYSIEVLEMFSEHEPREVFVVKKSSDFTEGRGPYLVDQIYDTQEAAEAYVRTQGGIFGSKQYDKPTEHSKPGRLMYNGYVIETAQLRTAADILSPQKREGLEKQAAMHEHQAREIRKQLGQI